ncbi:MAG: hypothetical protein KDC53_02785 [Saprospiraceae bacterium]|nr:hypothetical protein [Saprospiraceae bacterium]
MRHHLQVYYVTFLILLFVHPVFAQHGEAMIFGHKYSVHSEILQEERPYMVYLPESYANDENPFIVLYLLDGQAHFLHTAGIVSFLMSQEKIPGVIVVAVPNTSDRTHDLTPGIELDSSAMAGFPSAGGADNMLKFLRDELIPEIESKYRTAPFRILVGHSFGGIFSINALMQEPDLFGAHVSISPSLWWDQQNLVRKVDDFISSRDTLDVFYYMTMGNEGGSMLGGAMKVAALFEEKAPVDFQWDFKVMEEETHGSIPHRSLYQGLEAIFKEWADADLEELFVLGGISGIENHYKKYAKKYGLHSELTESLINELGYDLLHKGAYASALQVFLENISRFPNSGNTYDSVGEVYSEIGDPQKAIEYYKKSLEYNPVNENAVKMLDQLGVKVDPMENQIEITPQLMQKIVGVYAADQAGEVTIANVNGKAILTGTGLPEQTLKAFPNNLFALTPANVILFFTYNLDGNIEGYEVQFGVGQKQFVNKVK